MPEGLAWKDVVVPKHYPSELRDDVVRVARSREPGVTIVQIAKDFGIHPMTLQKWLACSGVGHLRIISLVAFRTREPSHDPGMLGDVAGTPSGLVITPRGEAPRYVTTIERATLRR